MVGYYNNTFLLNGEKIVMSLANGALDIVVTKNPTENWDSKQGDHFTGMQIKPDEWEDLFQNVLQSPQIRFNVGNETFNTYYERQRTVFQSDLENKGFEMLGRIWDIYQDAYYMPSEINKLLEECLKIQQVSQSAKAMSALKKIICACRKALDTKSGIFFASD